MAYFASLDTKEQNEWIEWEHQRGRAIVDAIERAHTLNEDDKIYAETVTARLLVELLRMG